MQKRESLCAVFCSSRAAEEGSGIFRIMIELTNLVVMGSPRLIEGKQGCLCVCVPRLPSYNRSEIHFKSCITEVSTETLYNL